tara:strand:- start:4062 stop:5750 length:1689 start_codon:yes stop_codon:yes gene_type:complete
MEIDWFDTIFKFLGGLGLFFYGMKIFSDTLQAMGGHLIRKVLNSLTANRVLGVFCGAFVTTLVQSSSVVTVMTVGMVNAGVMTLAQAVSIIFGANIGTTITGWIISFKLGKYGLHMIGLGSLGNMFIKSEKLKRLAILLMALGLIFYGLKTMSGAFKPLRTDPTFIGYLTYFQATDLISILATVAMGCILTLIVQSSSAMLGITIALAVAGTISFNTAAALVLGENIGTTITALLASVGTNANAKRAAAAHALFNLTGVLIMVMIFQWYVGFIDYLVPGDPNAMAPDGTKPAIAQHIAMVHTIFNVSASIIFLPFLGFLVNMVTNLIKDGQSTSQSPALTLPDNVDNISPVLALELAHRELIKMTDCARDGIEHTQKYVLSKTKDKKARKEVINIENHLDEMQRDMTLYLSKVMRIPLSINQSRRITSFMSISDDLESVTDYCADLVTHRKRLFDDDHELSETTEKELISIFEGIKEMFSLVESEIHNSETASIQRFDALITEFKKTADNIKDSHLERVSRGEYNPLSNLIFSDLVVSIRKIAGHIGGINKATSAMNFEYKI